FAVQGDRYPTLQRSKVIQSNHRSTTALDDVLEDLGGFFKENRCACFSDGNTSARSKCPVQALQRHQVTSFIDDGNHTARSIQLLSFGRGSCDHCASSIERQRLSCCDLGLSHSRDREYSQSQQNIFEFHTLSLSLNLARRPFLGFTWCVPADALKCHRLLYG